MKAWFDIILGILIGWSNKMVHLITPQHLFSVVFPLNISYNKDSARYLIECSPDYCEWNDTLIVEIINFGICLKLLRRNKL